MAVGSRISTTDIDNNIIISVLIQQFHCILQFKCMPACLIQKIIYHISSDQSA